VSNNNGKNQHLQNQMVEKWWSYTQIPIGKKASFNFQGWKSPIVLEQRLLTYYSWNLFLCESVIWVRLMNQHKNTKQNKDKPYCYLESYVICRTIVLWGLRVTCPRTYELRRKKCRGSGYGS
jgi:hypothetical protein